MPPELIELTRKMREAQKAYFASRTNGRLQESIRLEKLVDAELAKIKTSEVLKFQQGRMF